MVVDSVHVTIATTHKSAPVYDPEHSIIGASVVITDSLGQYSQLAQSSDRGYREMVRGGSVGGRPMTVTVVTVDTNSSVKMLIQVI